MLFGSIKYHLARWNHAPCSHHVRQLNLLLICFSHKKKLILRACKERPSVIKYINTAHALNIEFQCEFFISTQRLYLFKTNKKLSDECKTWLSCHYIPGMKFYMNRKATRSSRNKKVLYNNLCRHPYQQLGSWCVCAYSMRQFQLLKENSRKGCWQENRSIYNESSISLHRIRETVN